MIRNMERFVYPVWFCGVCGGPVMDVNLAKSASCPLCGRQGMWAQGRVFVREGLLVIGDERIEDGG